MRLNGDISHLSGFVAFMGIGFPVQDLRLAIDFSASGSTIFTEENCPAFQTCYDPMASLTSIPSSADTQSYVVDNVWLGQSKCYRDLQFQRGGPPDSAQFRDVAGIVAGGPQSTLFADRVLELGRDTTYHSFDINEVGIPQGVDWIRSVSESRWEMEASLSGQPVSVVFAMTQDLVLPWHWRLFPDIPDKELELVVGSTTLRFNPQKVRVRFDPETTSVMIGVLLISSTQRIIFNYMDRSIALQPYTDAAMFHDAAVNLPSFDSPVLKIGRLIAPNDGNLILGSLVRESDIYDHDGSPMDCWKLDRIKPELPIDIESSFSITGPFEELIPPHLSSRSGLVWGLIPKQKLSGRFVTTVHVRNEPKFVAICAAIGQDLSAEFDVPQPTHASSDDCCKECVICQESFRKGDWVQSLTNCNHVFHSDCVRRWVTHNPSCPTCRTAVERANFRGPLIPSWEDSHRFPGCLIC